MHKPSLFVLRVLLVFLLTAYAVAMWVQWHWPPLSAEAEQYQKIAIEVTNGPSLSYALEKLLWVVGNLLGLVGIALLFARRRLGLPPLVASLPLLIAAEIFGAPEPYFPAIARESTTLLWPIAAATWGCAVTYAWAAAEGLFATQRSDSSHHEPREGVRLEC